VTLAVSTHASILRGGESMRPDVVAGVLARVEDEWRTQAAAFTEGSASEAKTAPGAFSKSCATVVSAVIQGSGGDRSIAKEYMSNVCNQKVLASWHKLRCTALATSITDHAMRADTYANRQMNPAKVCTGFWSVFVEAEKNREAEEAKLKAEQEKVRVEEEKKAAIAKAEQDKKDAIAKAEAMKKAEAEAKIEAERRAKEQAEREKAEKEEKARHDAAEAKARAAEAAAKLAEKRAEAEKMQKEAQQKMEEAEKAEAEHKARLAEHVQAEKALNEAAKKPAEVKAVAAQAPAKPAEVKPAAVANLAAKALPVAAKEAAAKTVAEPKPKTAAVAKAEAPVAKKVDVAPAKKVAFMEQDPCAGCTEGLAQAYQSCAMAHGNPCAETNKAGIVGSGPGTKKDIGCCMKKEKHDRCLQCSSMDCAHGTCNVNKKYYNQRTMGEKFDDKKAMKKAGWGK